MKTEEILQEEEDREVFGGVEFYDRIEKRCQEIREKQDAEYDRKKAEKTKK